MAKRKQKDLNEDQPFIDASYEQRFEHLHSIEGSVHDYEHEDETPNMGNRSNLPYVPARREQEQFRLSADGSPMPVIQAQPVNLPSLPQSTRSGHVRQTDDPMTNAKASLLYSAVYAGVVGFIVGALLLLASYTYGYDIDLISSIGIEICATGIAALIVLAVNRHQGLHHSATGIAHHEIKATRAMNRDNNDVEKFRIAKQAEVATHAIDKHVEMLEKKWRIEQQMNQKRLPGE